MHLVLELSLVILALMLFLLLSQIPCQAQVCVHCALLAQSLLQEVHLALNAQLADLESIL